MTLDSIKAGHFAVCSGMIKYLKCTSVGSDKSAKIVDDLQFFLGLAFLWSKT